MSEGVCLHLMSLWMTQLLRNEDSSSELMSQRDQFGLESCYVVLRSGRAVYISCGICGLEHCMLTLA